MDALDEARRLTAATYDERALPLTEETQWLFTRREVERAAPAVREGRTRACELYARQQAVKRVITLNLYLWNRMYVCPLSPTALCKCLEKRGADRGLSSAQPGTPGPHHGLHVHPQVLHV